MPYRLSSLAEQDLEEIWSYVAEDASFTTADRLLDSIFDRLELSAEHPRIGRVRPEFAKAGATVVDAVVHGLGRATRRYRLHRERERSAAAPDLFPCCHTAHRLTMTIAGLRASRFLLRS